MKIPPARTNLLFPCGSAVFSPFSAMCPKQFSCALCGRHFLLFYTVVGLCCVHLLHSHSFSSSNSLMFVSNSILPAGKRTLLTFYACGFAEDKNRHFDTLHAHTFAGFWFGSLVDSFWIEMTRWWIARFAILVHWF